MTIGWNGETLPALPLAHEIDVVAQAGYQGLEIFIPKLATFLEADGARGLAARLKAAHLAPLAMNGIENINLLPPDRFAQLCDECRRLAEVCAVLGCPTIVAVPSPRPEGVGWPEVREDTAAALRALADTAAPHGVRIGLEFLAPAACSVRTLAQANEIAGACQRPNVGVILDTYHYHVGGSSRESLLDVPIDRLFLVHINDVEGGPPAELIDGHRLLPGEGVLPLPRILSTLHGRGYRGAYSLEVMRPAYREREPLEYARAGYLAVRDALRAGGVIPIV